MMDYMPIQSLSPVTSECVVAASNRYLVPPLVILSVLGVEGGTVGNVSKNTNGTVDIGPMQINSVHMPTLAQYGITMDHLKNNGCLNISVGTYLIKKAELELSKTLSMAIPANYWKSVANYHSKTPDKNAKYLAKVVAKANSMPKEWKEFDCRKYNACAISATQSGVASSTQKNYPQAVAYSQTVAMNSVKQLTPYRK